MKLLTYLVNGKEKVGVLTPCGKKVVPLNENGFDYRQNDR